MPVRKFCLLLTCPQSLCGSPRTAPRAADGLQVRTSSSVPWTSHLNLGVGSGGATRRDRDRDGGRFTGGWALGGAWPAGPALGSPQRPRTGPTESVQVGWSAEHSQTPPVRRGPTWASMAAMGPCGVSTHFLPISGGNGTVLLSPTGGQIEAPWLKCRITKADAP